MPPALYRWSPAFSEPMAHYTFTPTGRLTVFITGDGRWHKWEVRRTVALGDVVSAYGRIPRDGNRSLRAAKRAAEEAFESAGGE